MSRGAKTPLTEFEDTKLLKAAQERGWAQAGSNNRFFFEYEPESGVYDANQETENKYDPVITDSDFTTRVYLDAGSKFQAKIKIGLGAVDDLFPESLEGYGEETCYEVADRRIKVELAEGDNDYERALEEVEELAKLLSQGAQEHYIDKLDRLEPA